jgi:hypothetical protein
MIFRLGDITAVSIAQGQRQPYSPPMAFNNRMFVRVPNKAWNSVNLTVFSPRIMLLKNRDIKAPPGAVGMQGSA